jgi:rubrerythrin
LLALVERESSPLKMERGKKEE